MKEWEGHLCKRCWAGSGIELGVCKDLKENKCDWRFVRESVTQGLNGGASYSKLCMCDKNLGFYSKCNGKSWECFKVGLVPCSEF